MDFDLLFSGVPVSDFEVAQAWYRNFFGRAEDVVAHSEEVLWRVSDGGWLYIVRDAARAGKGLVAMAVPDIELATMALDSRGIATGPIRPEGDIARRAVVLDPDGNSISIIQVDTDA